MNQNDPITDGDSRTPRLLDPSALIPGARRGVTRWHVVLPDGRVLEGPDHWLDTVECVAGAEVCVSVACDQTLAAALLLAARSAAGSPSIEISHGADGVNDVHAGGRWIGDWRSTTEGAVARAADGTTAVFDDAEGDARWEAAGWLAGTLQ